MVDEELLDEQRQAPPHLFVLFGATGDLAKRKLLPALYNLHRAHLLPQPFAVVGAARGQMTTDQFHALVKESVQQFSRQEPNDDPEWADFIQAFSYCPLDATAASDYQNLRSMVETLERELGLPGNRVFYLAMAPSLFGPVTLNLRDCGLTQGNGWKRLIIEKPFGRDYESAKQLNEQLRQVFEEEEIYRIDHYLGKEMVQNIEVIRFANSIFEPVWNNRSIANVQITSSETVGVEDRAGYYESAGALRDMVQNHMLQMVMMVAMEPPSRLKTEAIRDEKVKVLRSLRRYQPAEVAANVVRGQYGAGTVNGQAVKAYREEPNVKPDSQTETFIAARLYVDNFRWAGVPFYIRTGKRMARKSTEIVIHFKDMPKHLYFNQDGNLGPNLLVIRVNPVEGMYIQLNAKRPGTDGTVIPVAMEFSQQQDNSPEAYERLLYDAMRGDSTVFTLWDEVSLAWKFVDPIAEAFASGSPALETYAAGSWGPDASKGLLASDGYHWWPVYGEETQSVDSLLARQNGAPDVKRALEVSRA
ncbi:MAG: glucose-6-phosphate dehydrogenase [Alicyclobacillus sp.]|nr:glucose-6-phosphate dehydrogenase [Alicyclobacillus sp.]